MRRSAAPSQIGNAAKRGRFVPPFRGSFSSSASHVHASPGTPETVENDDQKASIPVSLKSLNASTLPKRNVLSLIQGTHDNNSTKLDQSGGLAGGEATENNILAAPEDEKMVLADHKDHGKFTNDGSKISNSVDESDESATRVEQSSDRAPLTANVRKTLPGKRTFKAPVQLRQTHTNTLPVHNTETTDQEQIYYSVMWCKRSKKKHKKWEGDAVMVARAKSVSLLDMDGKEIGKSSGYKTSEIQNMEEGQSLFIGGKEIEVMGNISRDDFRAGKCFQSAVTNSTTSSLPRNAPPIPKGFTNPKKSTKLMSEAPQKPSTSITTTTSLFDPSSPDALVLLRPSSSHQWQNNNRQTTVVDVVVDPYLVCKLRPHQREGVSFLYECAMGMRGFSGNGAILADDMGLGKTLQCITLIWTLYQQGPYGGKPVVRRILVVTPGSLVKNWCREFNKWLGKERMNIFGVAGDKKVKEFMISTIYPVMVISYEMMVRYADDIRKIKFDLMVCDEAHRLKNNTIKTTSLLTSLDIKRRILLTGTPIQNDLQEFYSLAEFCNPSILGTSTSFHRLYEEPVLKSRQPDATEEEKTIGETRATELSRITSLFVLRRTQEINNKYLPPKVETVIFCRLKPLQVNLYKTMLASRLVRRCLSRSAFGGAHAPHLVCIGALKKLCNHPALLYQSSKDASKAANRREPSMDIYGDCEEESIFDGLYHLFPPEYEACSELSSDSGKLVVLAMMLRALHSSCSHERIVVVSNYTQTLDLLQKFCEGEGYCISRLDGSTPTAKRQQIVEGFNSKYTKATVFLLSSKAGGVGLNLIGASRLILYDIDWNPANDLQAMARVWRDGQKNKVYIYRLITAGTIEEKVYQRQISKQGLSGAVVDMTNRSEVKFSLEELKDLFTLHETALCLTHDMLDCHCTRMGESNVQVNDTSSSSLLRPCQLGRPSDVNTKTKNISMAELLQWQHHRNPFQQQFEDPLLAAALENISFIFQNETNSTEKTS